MLNLVNIEAVYKLNMGTSETGERNQILYKTAKVDDQDIFYREAGPRDVSLESNDSLNSS